MTTENKKALNQIYNTAFGHRTNLNELVDILKKVLSKFDNQIKDVNAINGPIREGDIPHSLAQLRKQKNY